MLPVDKIIDLWEKIRGSKGLNIISYIKIIFEASSVCVGK